MKPLIQLMLGLSYCMNEALTKRMYCCLLNPIVYCGDGLCKPAVLHLTGSEEFIILSSTSRSMVVVVPFNHFGLKAFELNAVLEASLCFVQEVQWAFI
jgi:hypothetical protein